MVLLYLGWLPNHTISKAYSRLKRYHSESHAIKEAKRQVGKGRKEVNNLGHITYIGSLSCLFRYPSGDKSLVVTHA